MSYKYNKAWRLKNRTKRNAERKKYYHKYPGLHMAGRRWSAPDDDFILMSKEPDRVLHVLLGRSVQAIQARRCKLMKEAW